MKIEVSEKTGLHLEQLAVERKLSVEQLLCAMLDVYDVKRNGATLQDLARNALEAGMATPHPVDTAERSREILQTEYADYLKRRRSQ